MNATAQSLSADAQALIDARLDTIDHLLIGKIPRADRLIIVDEVRNQIEEMLARREITANDPEAVLEVLRQLDPPEAYLNGLPSPASHLVKQPYQPAEKRRERSTPVGQWRDWMAVPSAFVASANSLLVAPLLLWITFVFNSEIVFFLLFMPAALLGLLLVIVAILSLSLKGNKKPLDYVAMTLACIAVVPALALAGYGLILAVDTVS